MIEKNSNDRLLKLIYILIPIFIITIILYSINPSTFILWLFSTITFV